MGQEPSERRQVPVKAEAVGLGKNGEQRRVTAPRNQSDSEESQDTSLSLAFVTSR